MDLLKTVKVNLQEGLLLDDNRVIGGYSHHNKVIVFTDYEPSYLGRLSSEFNTYEIVTYKTDSVSLQFYTPDGYKCFYDLKETV